MLLLGCIQQQQGKLPEAIALQPNLTIAHYNLGVTLDLKGIPEEARTCYQTKE